jgi:glucoamylase
VRLIRDLQTRTLVDQPAITRDRYVTDGPPAVVPVTIASPAAGAAVGGSTTVTGTTTPGAKVTVTEGQPGSPADSTTVASTTAGSDGEYSATVPTPTGSDLLTVAVNTSQSSSGWVQETVAGS